MKKKLLLIIMLFFALFTFAACDLFSDDGDDYVPYEGEEFLSAPVNLQINENTKVLSWNAVEHASKYEVYVNGKKKTTVTGTSYDFSSKSGDYLVFYVIAVGENYANSEKSVSIAYIKNTASVISAIIAAGEELDMMIDEASATELAKRGLTAEKFAKDVAVVKALIEAADSEGPVDMKVLNSKFSDLVNAKIDFVPYVSALLKLVQPELEDAYEQAFDSERQILGEILDLYETEYENLVLAVANTTEYFVKVYDLTKGNVADLVDEFKDLKGEPDWQTVFAIKKEITDDLLDRLPPVRDVSLVYRLTAKLLEALSGTDGIADVYYDNASALANQTVLKIKFSLNFLNEIDYAFYSEIRETLEEAPTAQQGAVESLILLILKYDEFVKDNEKLVNDLKSALTEEQKDQFLLAELRSQLATLENLTGFELEFDEDVYLDFVQVLKVLGEKAFDYLVASEGELIRLFATMASYHADSYWDYDGFYYIYDNEYTGETFEYRSQYEFARNITSIDLIAELVNLYKATCATLNDQQVDAIVAFINEVLGLIIDNTDIEPEGVWVIESLFEYFADHIDDAKALVDKFANHTVQVQFFAKLKETVTKVHNHYVEEYGEDYEGYEDNYDYEEYAYIIFVAKYLKPFYDTNDDDILALIDEFLDLMEVIDEEVNIDLEFDIDEVRENIDAWLENSYPLLDQIKNFDVDTLTGAQKEILDQFLRDLK